MRREWTRQDGVRVVYVQRGDFTSTVYLDRGHRIITKEYESWQRWQAKDEAEELAEVLGCEEVPHAA